MPKPIGNAIILHRRMINYLNRAEPVLAKILTNNWENQANAITYKEIREMILAGVITQQMMKEWQQDYSRLVERFVKPAYLAAMQKAAEFVHREFPLFIWDKDWWGVHNWIMTRGTNLAVQLSTVQHEALRAIVGQAATLSIPGMTVDELSRAIRPVIGLHSRFATATFNYYNKLRENGVSPKRARELQFNYAARLHRYRAMMIARTELAYAFTEGANSAIEQAQDQGLIGVVMKEWFTAQDERVCPRCGPMHGKRVRQDENFVDEETGVEVPYPPLHPHCRCMVSYIEL